MLFNVGDKVYRREAPGKRGVVCEICLKTGRYRVQWGQRRTWNKPESLVKVAE